MVAECGVNDLFRLAVAPGQLGTDLRVAPVHFVIGRLADIVQQPAPAGQRCRSAQLPPP